MVLEDCHITTEQTENSEKKERTQGTAPKELRAMRINYLILNSVRKMKSTTCLQLKSPLSKKGVERAKLYQ